MSVSFFVHGNPQPAGSRSFYGMSKSGKAIMAPANKKQKSWQELVRLEAKRAWGDKPLLTGPVTLVTFWVLVRPKSHYRTGKNRSKLRLDAPVVCAVKPDEDKLQRALRDALTGIVWKDDAQVVCCFSYKAYTDDGHDVGVQVSVTEYNEWDFRVVQGMLHKSHMFMGARP
jgi:crossover junction endodeoxyribonuclease RusA